MVKLFFVQLRKSICRTVLFAVFMELSLVSKCESSQKICIPGSRRNVSYVNVYSDQVDWDTASQICIAENLILPIICSKDDQDALVSHLNGNNTGPSSAWTSGKKTIFSNWTWNDGKPFTGFVSSSPDYESYTHVAFDTSQNNYKAADPRFPNNYLCQYTGSSCYSVGLNVIQVSNGCVRPSVDDQTWHNASSRCIANGSKLAVLTDRDLDTLKRSDKLRLDRSYWIGLQKNTTWHWMWLTTDKSSEDITYTNRPSWPNAFSRPEDICLSIDASNGAWKAASCKDQKMVVCERSAMSEISTESGMNSLPNVDSRFPLYLGAGAGIAIIVICIIVVILAVRHTRKSSKMTYQSKVEIDSAQNGRYEHLNKQTTSLIHAPANTPANASANAPALEPVAGTDDALGVYAEITPAPLNQSEEEAKIQQPGIVYAALEFKKEPTYLEPGLKNANATEPTKVGPMGDIYAIPDAKCRSGSDATSHPLLVTSQGDVYALPVKNSKSPTASSPVGGIYENL